MQEQLRLLAAQTSQTLDSAEKVDIIKYNTVYSVYKSSASRYKKNVLQTEDIFYRVKTLDKSVKEGEYDNNAPGFKKEYGELKPLLEAVKNDTEELSHKLNSMEPLYLRLQPKIQEIVDRLLSDSQP